MAEITFNGVTLEGSFTDVYFVDRIQKAAEQMEIDKRNADTLIEQLSVMDAFIDSVFGEGTAEKVFNRSGEMLERLDFIDMLFNEYGKSQQEVNKRTGKYLSRLK